MDPHRAPPAIFTSIRRSDGPTYGSLGSLPEVFGLSSLSQLSSSVSSPTAASARPLEAIPGADLPVVIADARGVITSALSSCVWITDAELKSLTPSSSPMVTSGGIKRAGSFPSKDARSPKGSPRGLKRPAGDMSPALSEPLEAGILGPAAVASSVSLGSGERYALPPSRVSNDCSAPAAKSSSTVTFEESSSDSHLKSGDGGTAVEEGPVLIFSGPPRFSPPVKRMVLSSSPQLSSLSLPILRRAAASSQPSSAPAPSSLGSSAEARDPTSLIREARSDPNLVAAVRDARFLGSSAPSSPQTGFRRGKILPLPDITALSRAAVSQTSAGGVGSAIDGSFFYLTNSSHGSVSRAVSVGDFSFLGADEDAAVAEHSENVTSLARRGRSRLYAHFRRQSKLRTVTSLELQHLDLSQQAAQLQSYCWGARHGPRGHERDTLLQDILSPAPIPDKKREKGAESFASETARRATALLTPMSGVLAGMRVDVGALTVLTAYAHNVHVTEGFERGVFDDLDTILGLTQDQRAQLCRLSSVQDAVARMHGVGSHISVVSALQRGGGVSSGEAGGDGNSDGCEELTAVSAPSVEAVASSAASCDTRFEEESSRRELPPPGWMSPHFVFSVVESMLGNASGVLPPSSVSCLNSWAFFNSEAVNRLQIPSVSLQALMRGKFRGRRRSSLGLSVASRSSSRTLLMAGTGGANATLQSSTSTSTLPLDATMDEDKAGVQEIGISLTPPLCALPAASGPCVGGAQASALHRLATSNLRANAEAAASSKFSLAAGGSHMWAPGAPASATILSTLRDSRGQ